MTARKAAASARAAPRAGRAAAAAAAAAPPPAGGGGGGGGGAPAWTARTQDVADPAVTIAPPHADSVRFVAGRLRRAGPDAAAESHFVCVVEEGEGGGREARRLVAVDNLEVLHAARQAGAARVGIRRVGRAAPAPARGQGGAGAMIEHLTRSSLRGTVDPFAAAEAVELIRQAGAGGAGGAARGGPDAGGMPYLGPYLERAVSLGFAGRPRRALSEMVRRVYACGVRQAPPLPFLTSVSRLDEDAQVAVAGMTARLCEAVRQRHFAWPGTDVIRLMLRNAGIAAGGGGREEDEAAGTGRLPPACRPGGAGNGGNGGAGNGANGGARAPAAGGRGATESHAARLSVFYCAGCGKRYCVLKGGVREVVEGGDGCLVVSPDAAGGEGAGRAAAKGAAARGAAVLHVLPSSQREYLGLDDDTSLRVVRAPSAAVLRKKADDLCRRGSDGPFMVLYAADLGGRRPGRGRKRRVEP